VVNVAVSTAVYIANQAVYVVSQVVEVYQAVVNTVVDYAVEAYEAVSEVVVEAYHEIKDVYDKYVKPHVDNVVETILENEVVQEIIAEYTWFMDEYGHYVEAAMIVVGAISAMAVAIPLLAGCAVAGIVVGVMIVVGVTIELAFAAAELQEGITGENYLKEYVFQGNEEAYALTLMITELAVAALTIVGGVMNAKQAVKASSNCFIAGTTVLTAVGVVAIENIEVGDLVLSYNEETGETEYKEVVQLFSNKASTRTQLSVEAEDGTVDEIVSTPGHKYYLPDNTENRNPNEVLEHTSYTGLNNKWVSAELLKKGDKVLLANADTLTGKPRYGIVINIKTEECEEYTTYNFEVEDFHTYYVGENGICVHNAGCGYESKSFHVDGKVGPYENIRVDVETAGSGRYSMHLQYKGGPGSPAKLPFDTSINKFVGIGADVFNASPKVRSAVISASKYIKGIGGVLHW
jgi:hypothetical protein